MSPEEVAAVVEGIRDQVRDRRAKTLPEIYDFELPSLEPLGRARDMAEGKAAAIGSVNPRPPGALSTLIQSGKKALARTLNWFVREQVEFNRATVIALDRQIEALDEINANLLRVAQEFSLFRRDAQARLEALEMQDRQGLTDLLEAWNVWRPAWEERAMQTETRLLSAVRDLEARARSERERVKTQQQTLHREYGDALARSGEEIQQRIWSDLDKLKANQEEALANLQQTFWADLEKVKLEHEREIETELRVIRRKLAGLEIAPAAAQDGAHAQPAPLAFDYQRFEERFRGSEEYVGSSQGFYLPFFEGAGRVADLGCGRGELLARLVEQGVEVVGVDLDPQAVAACREKGLAVERQDLFAFLAEQADDDLGGVVCAHVVEHLPTAQLPELMELLRAKLRPGGVAAFETPNPACLAIFAGDFYLDPTHVKPVPSKQLDFLLREAGFGKIEVHERHPATEVYPELAALDASEATRGFREKFFGGLDYAIIARKL